MNESMDSMTCDIAVIGGGPAGMMAAGTAAANGADVILIEKNRRPGRKLLITGKGRCNITNAAPDVRGFLEQFGKKGRYLHSLLHAFSVDDAMSFFTGRGCPVKVERGNRVFPESDSAADVLRVLQEYIKEHGVRVLYGREVLGLARENSHVTRITTGDGDIEARQIILCTGGLSYPATGSTGAGLEFCRDLGHTVVKPRPSLVPVILKEKWTGEIEGLSLRNVTVRLIHDGRTAGEEFGEALFTSNGMSGPVIIDLSRTVGEILPARLELSIDLKPALDRKALDERVRRDFGENPTRLFKNSLGRLLPASLIPVIVRLSGIDPQKTVSHITREERTKLVHLLKDLRATVAGIEGFDKAIITAGGISLDEIDMRTMRSRIIDNLYFAGEIIDIDGPTGGYNLQICWSTGYCAGLAAAEAL
ncbi:MAG TPA: NAD(P)/FAD-dependent oxidoreductase [Spirochaetota bacterium]|nr:NAD(P)/FAD-dependent oxidoreductase [Spirochaetota bacterium]HPC42619.1 NAD(P)/FAD-dependent oxidoreductase [Spirochaetota bacterium]HQJ72426.1 NAD(P)/FAD-dependent oxidoreductase [Spirochaetota bacterium]HRS78947.1 NAD(P)/FAD-dependent oxidoreductase [Spirochaetota bacterium]HRT76775.1 NAD(P)/FAD-dependent oxidoreductase [Spirochaetota bacterium]